MAALGTDKSNGSKPEEINKEKPLSRGCLK